MRRVVGSLLVVAAACASSRIPAVLKGYDIVIERRDDQSNELVRAFRERGLSVRRRVRGGSGSTAALIYFTFPRSGAPPAGESSWLHVRLADTRTGEILRAATISLDSIPSSLRARARAAVEALLAP